MTMIFRTMTLAVLLALSTSWAPGDVRRIEITSATQVESPIEFSLSVTPDDRQPGHVLIELLLPPGQQQLVDLWKVFLWVLRDGKTVLGVPLELVTSEDRSLSVRYHGHVDLIRESSIAIRCGENAPSAETIYQINVGSYLPEQGK